MLLGLFEEGDEYSAKSLDFKGAASFKKRNDGTDELL